MKVSPGVDMDAFYARLGQDVAMRETGYSNTRMPGMGFTDADGARRNGKGE